MTTPTWAWVINAMMATIAVAVNLWSTTGGTKVEAWTARVIAALALVYALGMIWGLTFGDIDDWAHAGRYIGLAAWPAVWILPAITTRVERFRIAHRIERLHDVG